MTSEVCAKAGEEPTTGLPLALSGHTRPPPSWFAPSAPPKPNGGGANAVDVESSWHPAHDWVCARRTISVGDGQGTTDIDHRRCAGVIGLFGGPDLVFVRRLGAARRAEDRDRAQDYDRVS